MEVIVQDADAALPPGFRALVEDCTLADRHAPFGEHTLLTLDGQRQVRHARLLSRLDDRLVGYAVLSEGLQAWYLELAVDPATRGRGVGTALLVAAGDHVASHGGGRLRGWAHAPGPQVERLVRDWSVSRVLHVLDRSLAEELPSPAVPDGLVLRHLDPASDEDRDAWLRLSNAAFEGHPENGGWDRHEVDWRMDSAWTDGRRFPVLESPEGLVAGVWTKVDEDGAGELYVVAVDPARQGQGLGRVVTLAALRALAAAGCERGLLYVDGDNAAALALYRRAGFDLHHVDRCHELVVPARGRVAANPTVS